MKFLDDFSKPILVLFLFFCVLGAAIIAKEKIHKDLLKLEGKDKWDTFVQEHNCKVVERNVPGSFFEPNLTAWLCDDGVKYYKPESYKKGFKNESEER